MISTADLKVALRVTHALDDAYIASLEAAAVAHVQNVTGNSYASGVATVLYLTGLGTPYLYLPVPIVTPVVLERAYPGGDSTAVTDFIVRDGYLLRTEGAVWTWSYEYQLTGNTGYGANAEPADVRLAVMQLVTHWYEIRTPVLAGVSVSVVPLSVTELLAPHIHYPVA